MPKKDYRKDNCKEFSYKFNLPRCCNYAQYVVSIMLHCVVNKKLSKTSA